MTRRCAVLVAALCLGSPVLAQTGTDENRYAVVELSDGLLRVDKRSGEVSRCTDAGGPLTCRLLPDERVAYEAEIDRLSRRLDVVEREIAALKERAPGPDSMTEPLPSDEELDRYMNLAEQMMRRFFDLVRELKGEGGPKEL